MHIISIITPSFNRADIIHETAESIFSQTYPHWEWIIVDDGSTDNSWELLQQYAARDNRVKVFQRNRDPKGACPCRNIAVDYCNGEYVMFLDTDDVIEPFCIENRIHSMLSNPELDFGIFPSLMFSKKTYDLNLWWNIDKPVTELVRQFHQDAICQGTGILIKKSSFLKVGRWDEYLHLWQDIDLFFRLYIQGYRYKKFFNLPPDLHNRVNHQSLSRNNFLATAKQESRVVVIKKAVDLLKKNKQENLLPEAKYMLAEIVSGMARTKNYAGAKEMINWGFEEQVITEQEVKLLGSYVNYYRLRLYKLPYLKHRGEKVYRHFHVESTLGKLTYQS